MGDTEVEVSTSEKLLGIWGSVKLIRLVKTRRETGKRTLFQTLHTKSKVGLPKTLLERVATTASSPLIYPLIALCLTNFEKCPLVTLHMYYYFKRVLRFIFPAFPPYLNAF